MYARGALDADSARQIERLVPDAIALTDGEAAAFCANSVVDRPDGRHAGLHAAAGAELRARGFEPVVVDVSSSSRPAAGRAA